MRWALVMWPLPEGCRPQAEPCPVLQVSECGWAARRAPSLRSLHSVCRDMHWWLRQDRRNVCVLHCVVSGGLPGSSSWPRGRRTGLGRGGAPC